MSVRKVLARQSEQAALRSWQPKPTKVYFRLSLCVCCGSAWSSAHPSVWGPGRWRPLSCGSRSKGRRRVGHWLFMLLSGSDTYQFLSISLARASYRARLNTEAAKGSTPAICPEGEPEPLRSAFRTPAGVALLLGYISGQD